MELFTLGSVLLFITLATAQDAPSGQPGQTDMRPDPTLYIAFSGPSHSTNSLVDSTAQTDVDKVEAAIPTLVIHDHPTSFTTVTIVSTEAATPTLAPPSPSAVAGKPTRSDLPLRMQC